MTAHVDVQTVATQLGVSNMTVYRLVHSGELKSIKVGRLFRIPRSEMDRLLREGTTP